MAGFPVDRSPSFRSKSCDSLDRIPEVRQVLRQIPPSPTFQAFPSFDGLQHGGDNIDRVNKETTSTTEKGHALYRSPFAYAARKVAPAVVHLQTPQQGQSASLTGSGTIIREDGFILTCAHGVCSTADRKVDVYLQGSKQPLKGTSVTDRTIDIDIAIVKIEPDVAPFPTAKLGPSIKPRNTDWVVAIGSPASLVDSVTHGIISNCRRESSYVQQLTRDTNFKKRIGAVKEYLQTDCAINEGNSGGPLCNTAGEVVGVNVFTTQHTQGIGFAIPINDHISRFIESLCKMWEFGHNTNNNVKLRRNPYQKLSPAKGDFRNEPIDAVDQLNKSQVGSIKGGNSRGPLHNIAGESAGLIASTSNNEGISFAASVDQSLTIIEPFNKIWSTFRPNSRGAVRYIFNNTEQIMDALAYRFRPLIEGNSLGPLCNIVGEAIDGLSFSVPMDQISTIIKPFRTSWTTVRPDFDGAVCYIIKQLRRINQKFPNAEGVLVQEGKFEALSTQVLESSTPIEEDEIIGHERHRRTQGYELFGATPECIKLAFQLKMANTQNAELRLKIHNLEEKIEDNKQKMQEMVKEKIEEERRKMDEMLKQKIEDERKKIEEKMEEDRRKLEEIRREMNCIVALMEEMRSEKKGRGSDGN